MAKVSYGNRMGHFRKTTKKDSGTAAKSPEDVVREIKKEQLKSSEEAYRERALALYGLICARCGREFDNANRHLLTVHHKDGDHHNNPPDGSNWEMLCAYCHEDVHSREILGNYLDGKGEGRESSIVYRDPGQSLGGTLADQLKKIWEDRQKSRS